MSVRAYDFSGGKEKARQEILRFEKEAGVFKPSGFNADAEKRLLCYLHQHRRYVVQALEKRFPQTWQEISAVTLPLTQFFVDERSKVFLDGVDLELADAKGEPLDSSEESGPHELWEDLVEEVGLVGKLKRVDRYATLFNTCFLMWGHSVRGPAAFVVFPQQVEVVFDPAFPFDLDMAHGVRIELGSDGSTSTVLGADGKPATTERKRFAFWCAREGEEQFQILYSDGDVEKTKDNPDGKLPAYRDDESRAIVPVVMFTQHTEELGAFTLSGQGLHLFDIDFCLALSNLQHVCEANGFGQLVISTQEGSEPPKQGTIVRGPTRAITLPSGNNAEILAGAAPIADLIEKLRTDLRLAALTHKIPPGAVSLEARAVASGVALQIEMRPLLETRQDSVETYAAPMRRLFKVARAVWNGYAQEVGGGKKKLPDTIRASWTPGPVQMPTDPQAELDQAIVEIQNDLATPVEVLARFRRLPMDEAEKRYQEIRSKNAELRAARRGAPGEPPPAPGTEGQPPAGAPGLAAAARAAAGEKPPVQPPGAQRRGSAAAQE